MPSFQIWEVPEISFLSSQSPSCQHLEDYSPNSRGPVEGRAGFAVEIVFSLSNPGLNALGKEEDAGVMLLVTKWKH